MDFAVLIVLFLSLLSTGHAACTQGWYGKLDAGDTFWIGDNSQASADSVCQRLDSRYTAVRLSYNSYGTVSFDCINGSVFVGHSGSIVSTWLTPSGGHVSSSTDAACSVVPTCVAGVHVNNEASGPTTVCHGGCQWSSYRSIGSGVLTSGYLSTGQLCTNAPDFPTSTVVPTENPNNGSGPCPGGADVCNAIDGQCPKGTFAEDVAGQAMCIKIPKSSDAVASGAAEGASQPATTGTTSSNTTSTTTTSTVTNPDGSTTTTSTTSTTGTETKPNDMGTFCRDNPQASVCMDAGSFSGSCGHFVCSGDAVQCATARAVNQAQCDSHIDASDPLVTGGQSVLANASSAAGANQPSAGSTSIGTFDTTNPYSSQCPADLTVPVGDKSFVIPFSKSCSYIQFIGWCLVAGASLAGARIAFGRG